MLNHISIWQMVIDVCLITSILVMAFRYAKSSRAHVLLPRIVELEGRISVLMAEAEGRAKHISDQLLRREQQLSRAVSDIEKRGKDVSLALGEGEDLTKELSLLCEGARREALELERALAEARSMRDEQVAPRKRERRAEYERLRGTSPNEQEVEKNDQQKFSTRGGGSRRAPEWMEDVTGGESHSSNAESKRPPAKSLRDTYKTAEQMLKQGRDAEEVSERTSLPIEGVKRLAQMIEIEREERDDGMARFPVGKGAADPRLGALGVSRRGNPNA
jgi:hypothetical protein